ncbi:MAG: ATP-grasp fold amidoligase family protein [Anaerococcus vaginalis]|nr:ATP-grasp fold amidoligase family protein [Anaerococcus vaginalis]
MVNNIIKKANKYISNQEYRLRVNSKLGLYNNMDDKKFIEKMFKATMDYPLNLENPKSFNEKLQWLKLYDRNPLYTKLVDKYKVREYISEKIGEDYLIPLLGVWDDPEEIDFDSLPNKFVLKCNHNSGLGMCICTDKSKIDIKKVKNELKSGLAQNYYLNGREWPYKNVQRKIIAEKYMVNDSNSNEFTDYKFFCFNGYVDCVMVCLDRSSGNPKFYFFDKDWNFKRYDQLGLTMPEDFTIDKPKCIDEMFEIASELSKGIPYVRVDLYQSYNKIFFGELTFYPDSGFVSTITPEADLHWGNLIDISNINNKY